MDLQNFPRGTWPTKEKTDRKIRARDPPRQATPVVPKRTRTIVVPTQASFVFRDGHPNKCTKDRSFGQGSLFRTNIRDIYTGPPPGL